MATYKGIQGMAVIPVTSDPTPAETYAGQLWYNSADGKFKIAVAGDGTWASGGTMNTARSQGEGATSGTATAALAFGGPGPVGSGSTAYTESYNGTAWTEVNDLNSGRPGILWRSWKSNCRFGFWRLTSACWKV